MRRKAGHSMMRRAPSTPLSEGLPTWTVLMNRHEVRRRRPAHPRKPRDRTSRPESQASERHRSRSACTGTQHHPLCRSSDGQRPADRTMDATDTKARESRSRGCYQAALYNLERPHQALGMDVPASRYRPSSRAMPDRLPRVEYDSGEIVRTVSSTRHYVSFKGRMWKVPQAIARERLAI